ncbi:MAG: hypothetical protein QXG01_01940, partial [Candidatus Bathyarchaeia archaeon]
MERAIQALKDRTECFDDYFPCWREKKSCKARHARNWISLFQIWHNIVHIGFDEFSKSELPSLEALRFIDFMRGRILS